MSVFDGRYDVNTTGTDRRDGGLQDNSGLTMSTMECADRRESRLHRLLGAFWATIYLVFLGYPLSDLLNSSSSPLRFWSAIAGLALFVSAYFYLWIDISRTRRRLATVAVITALAVILPLAYGPDWLGLFIYATTASAVTLPRRTALYAVGGLTAVTILEAFWLGVNWGDMFPVVLLVPLLGMSMMGFTQIIRTNIELRAAREEIARLAVSEERLRFARDLHDLLGHSLSTIALKTELARRLVPDDPERAQREIGDIETIVRDALREVRETVSGYRQPTLANELYSAREILTAAGIQYLSEGNSGPLPPAVESVLAWVVREGVTNVIRHSRASRCVIRFENEGDSVGVEVLDNGQGWASSTDGDGSGYAGNGHNGNGLSGLAERVYRLDGSFEAGSPPSGGFRLWVRLPVGDSPRLPVNDIKDPLTV